MIKPAAKKTTWWFEVSRQPGEEWPDLRWPEWKPNTEKMMHPRAVYFHVDFDGRNYRVGEVRITGDRINATGLGASVTSRYWQSSGSVPGFAQAMADEAVEFARKDPYIA